MRHIRAYCSQHYLYPLIVRLEDTNHQSWEEDEYWMFRQPKWGAVKIHPSKVSSFAAMNGLKQVNLSNEMIHTVFLYLPKLKGIPLNLNWSIDPPKYMTKEEYFVNNPWFNAGKKVPYPKADPQDDPDDERPII